MLRIIGCGNPDRSDDAVGLLVARRLREMGIDARETTGDMLGLMEEWCGTDEVILIDAVVSGATPGTTTTWDASISPLPSRFFPCSTHALGVAEVVELARALHHLPAKLTVYGIEARSFERGLACSPEIVAAAEQAAQKVAAACNQQPALQFLPIRRGLCQTRNPKVGC